MRWRWPLAVCLLLFVGVRGGGVSAEDSRVTVTEVRDFVVVVTEPTDFYATTYQIVGVNSDPHLWLYDAENTLIASNDDYFGLQSHLSLVLSPGTYRLRAGVCCGNPDGWLQVPGWNAAYELMFSGSVVNATTTTALPASTSTAVTSTFVETTVVETSTTLTSTTTSSTSSTTTSTEVPVIESSTSTFAPQTTTEAPQTSPTTENQWTTTTDATTTTAPAGPPNLTIPVVSTPSSATSTSSIAPVSTSSTEPTLTTVVDATTVPPVEPEIVVSPADQVNFGEVTGAEIVEVLAPENLELLSDDAVKQLVENIAESDLTDEQADAIAVALSSAPDNVKEEFEDQVDIFGGQFDLYVPLGSLVNVGQRRVVVAATATVLVMPVPSSARGGDPSKKGKK